MADSNSPGMTLPARPPAQIGLPANFQLLTFDGFEGLNTKASRPGIGDQQMSWCSNWMPLGRNNLRTLYDVGASIYDAPSGMTISDFAFGNIDDTPLAIVFLSDGSIQSYHTTTDTSHQLSAPGTITSPSDQIGIAQWGSQFIAIVAPQTNGYFVTDDTNFYKAGTFGPFVTLLNAGLNYTSQPTIQAVGGPTGGIIASATFSAELTSAGSISKINVTAPGTGLTAVNATDATPLIFSGGGSKKTAYATTAISGGSITIASIQNSGGSGYMSNDSLFATVYGGGGIGATVVSASTLNGSVVSVVVSSGQGYTVPPVIVFSDPDNPVAEATVQSMPFGLQGTTIETFVNRVWISNGAAKSSPPERSLNTFSAPANPIDFNSADGAGQFLSTDSFLRVGVQALRQSNGFLYMLGDSSINYLSGVQTTGDPPTTSFSNQNVDPQVGTPWPDTVQVFNRTIVFANTTGVHAIYGGAVQKVSDALDGVYTTVTASGNPPVINGIMPSSAIATIFGITCYILLLPILDPISNETKNTLFLWDGKRWFSALPSVTLTKIATQEINSVLTAWGTDGDSIYQLFKTPSTAITKLVQSKLWDAPSYIMQKNAKQVFGLFKSNTNDIANFDVTVDTETQSATVSNSNVFGATWTNSNNVVAQWLNQSGDVVMWQATGLTNFLGTVDASGVLMGMSIASTAKDLTMISFALMTQQYKLNI